MMKENLSRRDILKGGLVGLVTLTSGLIVPETSAARDEDPGGTMDEPGLHMYICNYIEKEERKPVGKGKTRFFGEDRITLVMESGLIYKKRGYIEILNPKGNKINSRGYDFKITWGSEWFSLHTTAKDLRIILEQELMLENFILIRIIKKQSALKSDNN